MDSERLWAPWRIGYMLGETPPQAVPADELELLPGADPKCFLCKSAADTDDQRSLVVDRGSATITVLNLFPYNNGHLLISPARHVGKLTKLTEAEQSECLAKITQMTELIERLMQPDGFNVGLNLGRAAGAGVPGHLHWHIVPRWNGDSNFMPSLAATRVVSQSLEQLWVYLTDALGKDGT